MANGPLPPVENVAAAAAHAVGIGYQVVARRYRPQRFDELVGQEHVARGLSGAIDSGRVGHAYLFTGARGVGKTSAARIFAKALECTGEDAPEPCNRCDRCAAISAGQDIDVVEVDAASNRGIDEIRQLRQNVAVRPARGRFKIYIIDEVHMLTREAFNALLKTLEEPPAHVKFVLCTTEPEKLPITILSRCQRFDFQTVDAAAIARRLEQIVKAEGASVAPEALGLIARRAAGSMRDSQSLLEQLLGAADGPVGVDDVHAVIGTGREECVGAVVAAIAAGDARSAISAFDDALAGGADPGGVLEQLLAALRDALLASVGCGPERMREDGALGIDLAAFGRAAGTSRLLAMLQIIDHALGRMRISGHAAVLAEMAIVRLSCLEDLDSLADSVERVAAARGAAETEAKPAARFAGPGAVAAPVASPATSGGVSGDTREKKTTDRTVGGIEQAAEPEPWTPPPSPKDPHALWRDASEAMGGLAADFAALAGAVRWREDVLEVTLPSSATTALSFLRRPEVTAGLARILCERSGRQVRLGIVAQTPDSSDVNVGGASSVAAHDRARTATSQAVLLREAMEHPLVVHARTVFDAAVRKVEPPRPRQAIPQQPEATSIPADWQTPDHPGPAMAAETSADDADEEHVGMTDAGGGDA